MKIFFSVGEPSGDLHGANLIREMHARRPDIEFVGYGGPRMAAAGAKLHADLTALAIMWILRVILNIHKFWRLLIQADRFFQYHKPDAVVLIDYPGFNWWIARRAKAHGIPVFYYGTPQLWAWGAWRVKKMRRFVDHVLCKLPFEEQWFRERGCNATYVGHPYFDQLKGQKLDQEFMDRQRQKPGRLVTILPGSRTQEVASNLHWFIKAAGVLHKQIPDVRFAVASFKQSQAEEARRLATASGLPMEVFVGRTQELIHLAEGTMACSGSVSLELLYYSRPSVILYWVTPLSLKIQSFFRKVKYITLVNILASTDRFPRSVVTHDPDAAGAEAVPFPEYLTSEDKSARIAAHLARWLQDKSSHAAVAAKLEVIKEQVAHGGASCKATDYILQALDSQPRLVPRPHFIPSASASALSVARASRRDEDELPLADVA